MSVQECANTNLNYSPEPNNLEQRSSEILRIQGSFVSATRTIERKYYAIEVTNYEL